MQYTTSVLASSPASHQLGITEPAATNRNLGLQVVDSRIFDDPTDLLTSNLDVMKRCAGVKCKKIFKMLLGPWTP